MRELHANRKCPCESGLRYGACCKKKQFHWLEDADGNIHKKIPLSPAATEIIDGAASHYLRVFEREPFETDPIFLQKYLISEEEAERQTIAAMHKAQVRPEIIYAYQRTNGLLLSKENMSLASTKDVEDWDAAIDEYFMLVSNPPKPNVLDTHIESLNEELNACIICLGYVLENGGQSEILKKESSSTFLHWMIMFCFVQLKV